VVFIVVQNLVEMGYLVLKICEFQSYASLAVKRLFMPLLGEFFLGGGKNRGEHKHFAILSF